LYGRNYWTPQLLYIQAVYYIHQRSDSLAKAELSNIMKLFPNSPMFARAANLLGVLGRRKEIEEYLTNLDIERPVDQASVAANQPLMKQGPVITPKKIEPKPELPDSVQTQPARDAASSAVRDANRVALEKTCCDQFNRESRVRQPEAGKQPPPERGKFNGREGRCPAIRSEARCCWETILLSRQTAQGLQTIFAKG
jgi:hypothetical protein